ncbi:hypothetical protein ACFE04_030918 [Oxalis oulophora]
MKIFRIAFRFLYLSANPRHWQQHPPHHSHHHHTTIIDVDSEQEEQDIHDHETDALLTSPLHTTTTESSTHLHQSHHHTSININIDEQEFDRKTIARFVQEKDTISLTRFGGVKQVASVLGSTSLQAAGFDDQGSRIESESTTTPIRVKGYIYFLVQAAFNPTILLLLVSAVLSFFIEFREQGVESGWHDGFAIIAAVVIIVTVNSVSDFRRVTKEEKNLSDIRNKVKFIVVKRGLDVHTPISKIVVGDIVCLTEGDVVPADGLFIRGEGLLLDDGLFPNIDVELFPFLSCGSKVIQGSGAMLVTSIDKELSLNGQHHLEKPLFIWIDKATNFLENLGLGVPVLVAFVILIEVLIHDSRKHDDIISKLKGNFKVSLLIKVFHSIFMRPRGAISCLAGGITVFAIGCQHGMPFVISISLAFWKQKFMDNQASVQNLSACATIGVVTVLCVNATGGLRCNEVEINSFFIGDKDMITDHKDFKTNQVVLEALQQGICVSNFVPETSVTPTVRCLDSWAWSKWDMDLERVCRSLNILDYKIFNGDSRGVLVREIGDEKDASTIMCCHWKGDASTIIGMCSHYFDSTGHCQDIEDQRDRFEQGIKDMENNGLKPIALACVNTEVEVIRENGLHLLALVGFKYPYREEMKSALESIKNEDISIKLVSEDDLAVVTELSCELGIYSPGSNNMLSEGESFRVLDDAMRMEKVDELVVMGRFRPDDILLLVKCLKGKGHIVAFFGGLTVTDTPTLQEADVAISEMARDHSDIVILSRNSFTSILNLSKFAYQNIRTFIQLQLTVCISGLLVTSVVTVFPQRPPIAAVQLFWINWIMYLVGGFMMVMELKFPERPTNRNRSLITKTMWKNVIIQVLCQASVLLTFQFTGNHWMSKDVQQAMVFNTFSIMQIFNQFSAMNLQKEAFLQVLRENYCFLSAVGVSVILQIVVVQFMGSLAGCEKLNWLQWMLSIFFAAFSSGLDYVVNAIPMWGQFIVYCGDGLLASEGSVNNSMEKIIVVNKSHRRFFVPTWHFNNHYPIYMEINWTM